MKQVIATTKPGEPRPKEIAIGVQYTKVASNIEEIKCTVGEEESVMYQYTLTFYTNQEWAEKIAEENEQLKNSMLNLNMALIEIYDAIYPENG